MLTALTYAGLMWAVVHGKHVVEKVKRGEYADHPNPEHRPVDEGAADSSDGPSSGGTTESGREEGDGR